MTQTVYLDVLLCLNLFINYFILLACAKFTKISVRRRRLLLGAAVGALTSLIIVLPPLPGVLNFAAKLLIALLIVLATFGLHSCKIFLKNTAVFFFISFGFCGAMLALWFLFTPKGMVINNGAVYFNISPLVLVFSTLICYFILRLIGRLSDARAPQKVLCKVKIINGGNSCVFLGKLDTGNTLTEPFSQSPVIVADFHTVERVVPQDVKDYFTVLCVGRQNEESITYAKIRFIPFTSVGGEGLLPAFKPKQVFIDDHLCMKEIYIALCHKERLTGESRAIINTQCMD